MNLNPGQTEQYRRRHDAIWPELVDLLKSSGISDYTIWLDPETDHLFATLVRADNHTMERLADAEIMGRWWSMMGDIMQANPDSSPVQVELIKMFELA